MLLEYCNSDKQRLCILKKHILSPFLFSFKELHSLTDCSFLLSFSLFNVLVNCVLHLPDYVVSLFLSS